MNLASAMRFLAYKLYYSPQTIENLTLNQLYILIREPESYGSTTLEFNTMEDYERWLKSRK